MNAVEIARSFADPRAYGVAGRFRRRGGSHPQRICDLHVVGATRDQRQRLVGSQLRTRETSGLEVRDAGQRPEPLHRAGIEMRRLADIAERT